MNLTFVSKDNFIFRANSLVKIFFLAQLLILSMIFSHPLFLLAIFIILISITLFANCLKEVVNFLQFFLYIAFFIIIINAIFNQIGETVLFNISFFQKNPRIYRFTLEALISSSITIFKLLNTFIAFALLNVTINPDEIFQLLNKLRIPHTISLVISLSLQFFPILFKDLEKIKEIQQCHGVEMDKGNIFQKMKNGIQLMLPLLTNSLERSIQVAEALEARGYSGEKRRTSYNDINFNLEDYLVSIVNVIIIIISTIFVSYSHGIIEIYPQFTSISFEVNEIFFLVSYLLINHLLLYLLYLNGGKKN